MTFEHKVLAELLSSSFSREELIDRLQRHAEWRGILDALPREDAPEDALAHAVVRLLAQRAALDRDFFDAFRPPQPSRQVLFDVVSAFWISASADTEALTALGRRFFAAAGRAPSPGSTPSTFRARYLAQISQGQPPTASDVAALRAQLGPNERAYFLYRGELPRVVEEGLNALRLRGNPIAPLDAETMRIALKDGTARSTLLSRERTYFHSQNLFDMTNALTDRQFFFGRAALLTKIGAGLAQGDAVLLTGLRKSGKTSLLRILRYHLPEHPWCAVDLQGYRPEQDRDWPLSVFTSIIEAFDAWGRERLPDWPATARQPVVSGADFTRALRQRRQWQSQRGRSEPLVLVLDELERVFPTPRRPDRVDSYVYLTGALRAVSQSDGDRPIALIAAELRPTAHQINLLPGGETNPLFQFFKPTPLPMLSDAELSAMLHTIGATMGIEAIDEAFREAVYRFSGGHPGLARQLAAASYDVRQQTDALRAADFDAGLQKLEEQYTIGHFFEQNLWLPLTPAEQALIVSMASPKPRATWARRLGSLLGLDPDQPAPSPKTLAMLRSQGIIAGEQIAIAGFEEWLRATQPLHQAASK